MSKRLITDRDVLEGRVTSPCVLDGHTIATPSALDRMCRLGIVVVDGRAGAAPSPAPVGGAGHGASAAGVGGACPRCGAERCARSAEGPCERCCHGSEGALAAGAPAGLADGVYLVAVAGGRVASVLAATGPGRVVRAGGA